jgi:thiamine-monophosphate kinase
LRATSAAEAAARDAASHRAGVPSRALMQRAGAAAAGESPDAAASAGGVAGPSGRARATTAATRGWWPGRSSGWACRCASRGGRGRAAHADAAFERERVLAAHACEPPRGDEALVVDGVLGTGARARRAAGPPTRCARWRARAAAARRRRARRAHGLDATTGETFGDATLRADLTLPFGTCKRGPARRARPRRRDRRARHRPRRAGRRDDAPRAGTRPSCDASRRAVAPTRTRGRAAARHRRRRAGDGRRADARRRRGAAQRGGVVRCLVGAGASRPCRRGAGGARRAVAATTRGARRAGGRWADAVLVGPGLGGGRAALVERVLAPFAGPVVLDADALNAFAGELPALRAALGARRRCSRPHPLELARLAGVTLAEVLADRFASGRGGGRPRGTVLLKGVPTVLSAPDGTRLGSWRAAHAGRWPHGGSGGRARAASPGRCWPAPAAAAAVLTTRWLRRRAGGCTDGPPSWRRPPRGCATPRSATMLEDPTLPAAWPGHRRRRGTAAGESARIQCSPSCRRSRVSGPRSDPAASSAGAHHALGAGREFDLVRAMLARWGPLARGVGDDAAVLEVPPGERLVVSTDASVEDVHFRRAWLAASEIGWRAATSALSDLAAMGARPLGVLLTLAVPASWRDALGALADGVGEAVRAADTVIVGGDLTGGRELALTVTVLGAAARPVTRDGARAGDALWVTGRLGGPRRALAALLSGATPGPGDRTRFARPAARLAEGRWLAAHGASAMIDVSDGLLADLGHVAAASGARLVLDAALVPRADGAALEDALVGGEEYELALAAPDALDAAAFAALFGVPLTRVGRVEAGGRGAAGVEVAGLDPARRVEVPPGHDHFTA